jgi:RND family efflux transporter MFP subunit
MRRQTRRNKGLVDRNGGWMDRKYIIALIILILVGFLGWQVYQKISAKQRRSIHQQEVSVAVEVTPVKKSTIRDVGVFTGTLLPKSQFIAAPKIAGKLEKIFVNIGDQVKHGQLIALLDDDEYVQQVEQAIAEIAVARATLEEIRSTLSLARRGFERTKALREKEVISLSELDVAESQYKSQEAKQKVAIAQVAQKEALLNAAKVRLSYTRINASWPDGDGFRVVGERFVDEGAMLKANDPIVSILDLHSLTAVIHVIERDYARIKAGQAAMVTTDAFSGKTFTGTIARVAPLLKEAVRQARVEIRIPNPEGLLKPGMFVRAHIEFAKHDDANVIPATSLVKRDGQRGIFLVDTQTLKVRFIPVTLGIVNVEWVEVLKPPLSGLIVTIGQHLLEDGSAITLTDKTQGASSGEPVDSDQSKREQPNSGKKR